MTADDPANRYWRSSWRTVVGTRPVIAHGDTIGEWSTRTASACSTSRIPYFSAAIGIDLDAATRRIYVADTIRGLLVLEGTTTVFPP